VVERLQQRCAFDGDFHFSIRPLAWTSPKGVRKVAPACVFRKGDGA